jgi:hypothetical protein
MMHPEDRGASQGVPAPNHAAGINVNKEPRLELDRAQVCSNDAMSNCRAANVAA